MEDKVFFDELYQLWAKTTGAEDHFWMPKEALELGPPGKNFHIVAVGQDGEEKQVASFLSDEDSDFITAVHGCFGDLYRRLYSALDEADRADYDRDSRECRIAELELEVEKLTKVVNGLSTNPPWVSHG